MSKISFLCRVSAVALPCVFLRLRKRSQSEGRAKARCVNDECVLLDGYYNSYTEKDKK